MHTLFAASTFRHPPHTRPKRAGTAAGPSRSGRRCPLAKPVHGSASRKVISTFIEQKHLDNSQRSVLVKYEMIPQALDLVYGSDSISGLGRNR